MSWPGVAAARAAHGADTGEEFGVCVAVGVQQELLQHSGVGAEEEGSVQSPGKSKQEEQWGCSRKDVQCPKGRSGLPEPGPIDSDPQIQPCSSLLGRESPPVLP